LKKYFGTDGIRGIANKDLTPELAYRVGLAAAKHLHQSSLPLKVVLGRDTRKSGTMLGAALAAGLCSAGVDVDTLGVVPTGCVSYLTRTQSYGLGIVISASHNPAKDNGIKLFASSGEKLADDAECLIESYIQNQDVALAEPNDVGVITRSTELIDHYLNYLKSLLPDGLVGMKVAVDAAHGAASELVIQLLTELGAELHTVGTKPDGLNINLHVGATHPDSIQKLTQSVEADLGISFDGDADRVIFSDAQGRLINGDRVICLWSTHWHAQGILKPARVVGTVMSNGGVQRYLEAQGIQFDRTNVGDKYVSKRLHEVGSKIGGEQSGHIIFSDRGPTGDGLITMLEVLNVLRKSGKTLADFYGDFPYWPQVLINLETSNNQEYATSQKLLDFVQSAQERLGDAGRISVRPSGTQPILRVMVEAESYELRDEYADLLVNSILDELGGKIYSSVDLTHSLGE
jgi:phosphoglucosamine mutase